jgi:hypothetical protein
VLGPAALTFVGAVLMLHWPAPGAPAWALWAGLALQIALLAGTAVRWGPLMARLETAGGGLDPARYSLLLSTHWLRVGVVTAYSALLVWLVARALAA